MKKSYQNKHINSPIYLFISPSTSLQKASVAKAMQEFYCFVKEESNCASLAYLYIHFGINCIIWFIFIPFSWGFLLDKIIGKHYIKVTLLIVLLIGLFMIKDFAQTCKNIFKISVDFLNAFNALGINYTSSSVVVCAFIPIAIYVFLIRKIRLDRKK